MSDKVLVKLKLVPKTPPLVPWKKRLSYSWYNHCDMRAVVAVGLYLHLRNRQQFLSVAEISTFIMKAKFHNMMFESRGDLREAFSGVKSQEVEEVIRILLACLVSEEVMFEASLGVYRVNIKQMQTLLDAYKRIYPPKLKAKMKIVRA